MSTVFVTKEIPGLDRLSEFDFDVWTGRGPVPSDLLRSAAGEARGLLSMLTDTIDKSLLSGCPNLEVISQMAVGVDNIDIEACSRRGIVVGHTPDVLTETVADHAFALLAAVVRRIPEGEREVWAGEWGPWEPMHLVGGDLHGTTLGIVGMGRIGRAIARRASGFDIEVLYTSPSESAPEYERCTFESLLARSDHVVLAAPLNEDTRGLIGEEELRQMKTTAYLVNIARGPVVSSEALIEALDNGEIAGAALDVTDPEPIPANHPLVGRDDCLIVPHIASASMRTRHAMASLAVDNLLAGLSGEELPARYPTSG